MTTTRKPGRPPKSGETASERLQLRLTSAEREKWHALGGMAWLRPALQRAKRPG